LRWHEWRRNDQGRGPTEAEAAHRRGRGFEAELDKSTVSRIERCLVKPRRKTVKHLARGLEVRPLRLWRLIEADWADKTLAEHDAQESVA
jgi:hypothetical protein